MNHEKLAQLAEKHIDKLAAELDESGFKFDQDAARLLAAFYGLLGVMTNGTPEEYEDINNMVDQAMFRQWSAK